MRVAADHALRCAGDYFPAYAFHVGELINDEWLSAVDWHKPFHRDHITHQLMCVYVGRTVVNGGHAGEFMFSERPLIDWCVDVALNAPECEYLRDYLKAMGAPSFYFRRDGFGRKLWEQMFRESLFLACTYHDIGYPWQFVNRIHDQLRLHAPDDTPFGRGIDAIYHHHRHRLVMYPFNGYQPAVATQPTEWTARARNALRLGFSSTHGVPGAFAFLHLNDLIREYPTTPKEQAVSRFCLEWASMAIAMHDMQKLYAGDDCEPHPHLRVSFRRDPLSFVLTMIDQIQDFGRPNAFFRRGGGVTLTYGATCHRVEVNRGADGGELVFSYFFRDKGDARANKKRFKPLAQRAYFDPTSGYVDYGGLPISGIRLDAVHEPAGRWW
jgi:hypothetical protein